VNDTNKSPELFLGNPWAQLPTTRQTPSGFCLLLPSSGEKCPIASSNRVLKFCAASTITPSGPTPLKGVFSNRQPPARKRTLRFPEDRVYADVENVLHPNFWPSKLTRAGVVVAIACSSTSAQSKFNSRKLLFAEMFHLLPPQNTRSINATRHPRLGTADDPSVPPQTTTSQSTFPKSWLCFTTMAPVRYLASVMPIDDQHVAIRPEHLQAAV